MNFFWLIFLMWSVLTLKFENNSTANTLNLGLWGRWIRIRGRFGYQVKVIFESNQENFAIHYSKYWSILFSNLQGQNTSVNIFLFRKNSQELWPKCLFWRIIFFSFHPNIYVACSKCCYTFSLNKTSVYLEQ